MDVHQAAAASEDTLAPFAILGTPPEAAYDDLAQLASDLCDAPVALVTLFERSRQWFKARVGFDGESTSLGDALCAHALTVDKLLVIPDLSIDPRTRDNPLVAGGPAARFYAGAPLRSPEGIFLGTLCVVDFAPRPDGLTTAQASGLKALARQVIALLELRRLLRERDTALHVKSIERDLLASSEAHWRGLFEGLREGFAIADVIRDADGKIIDWRHLEVNQAFLDVAGFSMAQVIGRTLRDIAPHVPQTWIDFTAHVVESGEPATFTQVGARNGRTYDGRTFPIGGDQFAVIFVDVTDRIAAERRQAALIAIGDQLRDIDRVADMAEMTGRIVGETMGAIRAGYGRMDPERQLLTVEPDWTAPGVASIAGVHRYADYGDLLKELLAGEPLILNDVRTDPRTAADPQPMLGLGIAAQLHMPVRERGRTVAVLFVQADQPRQWSDEEILFLRNVADRLENAIRRRDDEARRIVQNEELSHRLKNTLAIVQAIASQTLKPINERALVDKFERRLGALATAHDVLLISDWKAAPLGTVIQSVLDTAGQEEQVTLDGPLVELSPRATLSASLLIHELVTNAIKYGALSVADGQVEVRWEVAERNGRAALTLHWDERNGPSVTAPTRQGFGSRLIKMGLAGTGGVDLDYTPAGLSARISAPIDDLTKI